MKENIQINYRKFLKKLKKNKQMLNIFKSKSFLLQEEKKNKHNDLNFTQYLSSFEKNNIISYIISISFLETNTFLHVMSSSGDLIFFCSAGNLKYKGKQKKLRFLIFQSMFNTLISKKLTFLNKKPLALHLNNVDLNKLWIIKKLSKKFYIKVIKSFNFYPYNGCRKKKIRRKKFKIKFMKKWLSGLKRQIVNLLSFLIEGSNPSFFNSLSKYNVAVACLLWEQKVMCSNHIISKFFRSDFII